MNLDDFERFHDIDLEDMYHHVQGLPDQLESAWQLGNNLPLPEVDSLKYVLVAGMGGSTIGADLLAAYISPLCPLPLFVHRDYGLPLWAQGAETLVITSSHSGNTEETLSVFDRALKSGCRLMVISTGGKMAAAGEAAGVPTWRFEHHGQPRAAVGFSFGLLLAVIHRLGLIPNPDENLKESVRAMRHQQVSLSADVPVVQNPAKRLAGQLVGNWVAVLGSDYLAPVARRWKTQISEIAKAWAQFESLPEADHNTLAGVVNPSEALVRTTVLFLNAPSNHSRNRLRIDLTRKGFMLAGMGTDIFNAQGNEPLAHIWTTLHFGDYLSYYLAMAYGVDPTPVHAIEELKVAMQN